MDWLNRWMERLKVLVRKDLVEEELNDEIQYHIEREIRENLQAGMTAEEAQRKAMVEFGGVERTKEQVRDVRGARGMDDLIRDVRVAFRSFLRRPGFALTAVGLMGLGIGSTTAIFSVVDGVLLRPLPYPNAKTLVYFDNGPHSHPDFLAFQEGLTTLDAMASLSNSSGSVSGGERTVRTSIANVTPGFFEILGGRAIRGRLFAEQDWEEDARLVVLDHGFWVRSWGGDEGVVGRQARLDGEPVTIVGILDPAFRPPEAMTTGSTVDVWQLTRRSSALNSTRDFQSLSLIGRLRDGVALDVAQAEVDALTASLAQEFPQYFTLNDGSVQAIPLVSLRKATVREASGNLLLLLGAAGLLLLIACANVANLFLAQGTSRAGELALRGALGASQGRITRQLLTESAFIALVGGVAGMACSYLGVGAFLRYGPENIPRLAEVAVDPRALLFAFGASILTGILCGVFPVFQARSGQVTQQLKEGGGRGSTGPGKGRIRDTLVVAELALSLVLLMGAGLLARSLFERLRVEPGLGADGLVVFALELGDSYSPEERTVFARELDAALEALPGVHTSAAGWAVPFVFPPRSCCWYSRVFSVEGGEPENLPSNVLHPVTPGYFETLGASLSHGREFLGQEDEENPNVVVINAPLAHRLFGDRDPVGKEIMVGENGPLTVVGVEAGVHHWALDVEVDEAAYVPYGTWGNWFGLLHVVLRTDLPLASVSPSIREVIRGLDPDMATDEIITMDDLISRTLATPRLLSALFGAFALVALLLACGGVYASMLYSVGQRKREMGIRLALGAESGQLVRMVLRDGGRLAALGLGLGMAGAVALSGVFSAMVWGVSTLDIWTYLGTSLLLGLTTLFACWIPARKASRTNLVETLKAE